MRTQYFFTTFILIFLSGSVMSAQKKDELTVMSFNIRYDNPADGENAWPLRRDDVATSILEIDPDILGLQEVLEGQLSDLLDRLPGYDHVGVGRDDGLRKGEFAPVFYRSTGFDLVRQETVWLSQTEDTASVGWDAALPRICTYVALRRQGTGDTVHVFNAHFDHEGRIARQMSAELILVKIAEWVPEGHAVIVMGDLNAPPGSLPVEILKGSLMDPEVVTGLTKGDPIGTYNGWLVNVPAKQRIDYIFCRGLTPVSYRHLGAMRENGRYLSDHFPVFAIFE